MSKKTSATIDLNCDLGEGMTNDASIMPYISSANIACGYHAGDVKTMYDTIALAAKHGVSVGAHVSYLDKENFGRTEMNLPAEDVYELIEQQLILFKEVADLFDIKISHVKPHGALYNQSAKDSKFANVIARAIKDFDHELVLIGLSGSHSISEANRLGISTASEVFADRSYQDDGSLTSRSQPGALLETSAAVTTQVLQMINEGTVTSVSGKIIPVVAETICIHGDGPKAIEFAKALHEVMPTKSPWRTI